MDTYKFFANQYTNNMVSKRLKIAILLRNKQWYREKLNDQHSNRKARKGDRNMTPVNERS